MFPFKSAFVPLSDAILVFMPLEDTNSSRESETQLLYDYPSPVTSSEKETACYERTPLLAADDHEEHVLPNYSLERLRPRLSRSSSVVSEKKEKLTIWTLSRSQKVTLAITASVDLLTYLSVSIMAPFFPEEVSSLSKYKYMQLNLCFVVLFVCFCCFVLSEKNSSETRSSSRTEQSNTHL